MSLKIKSITLIQHFTAQALRLRWLTLLAETALNLFVKVVDEDDVAINGVDVDVVSDSGQTNIDGELELYAVSGQENTVTASHNDYVTQQIILPAENAYPQQLNIQMVRSRLELKVVNNQNEPIEGATCRVLNAIGGNNVLSFDGVDDYVSKPYTAIIGSAFTIELFIKGAPAGASTYNRIMDLTQNSQNSVQFIGANTGNPGKVQFGVLAANTLRMVSSNAPVGNDWVHLVGTWNGSNAVQLYVNQTIQTGAAIGGMGAGAAGNWNTGRRSDGLAATYYNGLVSEIRLWDSVRTLQQIQENADKRLTGGESGLIIYYKLDEGTGTTATDSAGSYNGTIYGATWQEADESFPLFDDSIQGYEETPYDSQTTNANGLTTLNYQINTIHGLEVTLPGKRRFIMPFERTTRGLLDWQVMLSDYLATFATDKGNILINSEPENNDANFLIE